MAQGHIMPFLALALEIEQKKGYTITFINTPQNIKKLRSSLPPNSTIRLLEIPFCSSDHGLPPNTENTDTLPFHLMLRFLESSSSLKPSFRALISNLFAEKQGHPPLCIVADMFFAWSAEVAHEFGVFHAIFNATGGYGMAVYHTLWLNLPHEKTNADEFLLPDFPEESRIHVKELPEHLRIAKSTDSWTVFQQKLFHEWLNADGFLFNTVEELDHVGLLYFRRKIRRPVWPIGPIVLSMGSQARAGKEVGITWEFCNKWLDTKPSNSVLYISFGSQSTLSASQMMQLAMALEASGKFFVWVVRPPLEFDVNFDFEVEKWLPKGFKQRMTEQKQGLLVQNWAPQWEILSHKSVSAFLSHCGWNSVLEALTNGVPIMAWPMGAEQDFNAKMLEEEMGVCVGVARGNGCEVRHEDIVKKIELVMSGTEKGEDMRRKACDVREVSKKAMKDEEGFKGSSVKAMDEFLNSALLIREKTRL
ncbi:hypothetical protein L1049_019215 [Liquidambar formosana]|uniref:Glycosyltransferase n=1 Tax=Liquidambar formosana TaxID=63359 RepID=A0AAP0RB59_LIQFO